MNESLEPRTAHADRLGDAVLSVNDKFLRQTTDDLPAGRQRHCACRIDRPVDVIVGDLFIWAGNGNDAVLVFAAKMFAGKIYGRRLAPQLRSRARPRRRLC